jgi:uncharacterized membrane protein HdeD (DUF308 family)
MRRPERTNPVSRCSVLPHSDENGDPLVAIMGGDVVTSDKSSKNRRVGVLVGLLLLLLGLLLVGWSQEWRFSAVQIAGWVLQVGGVGYLSILVLLEDRARRRRGLMKDK